MEHTTSSTRWTPGLVLLLVLAASGATATTWFRAERADPLVAGGTCWGHNAGSWGSYIYGWPSKFDQIFWPYTDEESIWFCPASGLTFFVDDFEELAGPELEAVRDFLRMEFDPTESEPSLRRKLELLEGVYGYRMEQDPAFGAWMLRLLAVNYEMHLDDREAAQGYRTRALEMTIELLEGEIDLERRLESLFIATNYSLLEGHADAAAKYREQLVAELEAAESSDESGYAGHLSGLLEKVLDRGGWTTADEIAETRPRAGG